MQTTVARLAPWVLLLIHLPYLILQYSRLWNLEHYQFFPFALGAFCCLLYGRRLPGAFRWGYLSTVLVLADLALLAAGMWIFSPWLVNVGALLLLLAICRSMSDVAVNSSLGYLILLPLITLRLPLAMDLELIQWLQSITTRVASEVLNYLGFLHLREGNVLQFPGKRFLVAEACSGVQSLFTLIFLAAFITCAYRRKWFHTLLVLASAVCFSGVMNVLRISTISIAWFDYQVDYSTGWQHDAIGYAALVIAALLVFSTDAFVAFCCGPVPDVPGSAVTSLFRNPLTAIWNWFFYVPVRTAGEPTQSLSVVNSNTQDDLRRTLPGFLDVLRLRNAFGFSWAFIEGWFLSRTKGLLLLAVPFLIVGIGGSLFLWWLKSAPKGELVARYEAAVIESTQEKDPERTSVYLRSLVRLRPLEKRYNHQLAMHLLDQGQTSAAVSPIMQLTATSLKDGFVPTRLWLVRQANDPEPLFPLEKEQIEQQLLLALKQEPMSPEANRMLANFYAKSGQLKQAEDRLLKAVDFQPVLGLPLARIQRLLNRSDEQIVYHVELADEYFQSQLADNPNNTQFRIFRAEGLVLAGKLDDAEQLLNEGLLRDNENMDLRRALAELYSNVAAQHMRESTLNKEIAARIVAQAIALDPKNRGLLSQAVKLSAFGAIYTETELKPAIDALGNAEDLTADDYRLLAQATAAGGNVAEAIDRIEPHTTRFPELRGLHARLLKMAGRNEASVALTDQLIGEYEITDQQQLSDVLNHAELLLLASRWEEVRTLLKSSATRFEDATAADKQRRNILHSQACLQLFDERMKVASETAARTTTDEETSEIMSLLDEALITGSADTSVCARLARLSFSDSPLAPAAHRSLSRIMATGKFSAAVYNVAGTQALQADQPDKSLPFLERAYSLTPTNPQVLNNLAIALVRGEEKDTKRAMKLVSEALKILPQHPLALSTRAEILVADQHWPQARSDLEIALAKLPKNVVIRQLLVKVYDAVDEPVLAAEHRRMLNELNEKQSPKPL